MAGDGLLLWLLHETEAGSLAPHVIRLLAFLVILAAILDKNLRRT